MNKVLCSLTLLLVSGATLVAATSSGGDEESVRETVDAYFRGVTQADRSLLEKCWDVENAHMKYVRKDDDGKEWVRVVPIADAFDRWTRKPETNSSSKVLSLDIVEGKMAVVKYEFFYGDMEYIDYLSLYKIGGEWKIVNKIFVGKKKA